MKWQAKIRFTGKRAVDLHRVERERIRQAFTEWRMRLIDLIYPIAYPVGITIKWVNQYGMKVSSD